MAFSMYRCAACGSPNVVTDSQTGGIKYDYIKGAIGTVALGAGGAVAGISNESQLVYKCKDCGICLTYPMSAKMKSMIDLGVMSLEARKQLQFPWEIIKQQYKNIESGLADSSIQRDKDFLADSFMTKATKEEFDTAFDLLYEMDRRLGYEGKEKAVYSPSSPPTLTDYLAWQGAIKTVIENLGKYLPAPLPEKYRGQNLARIEGWFFAYVGFQLEAESGKPLLFSRRDMQRLNDYLDEDYFASTFLKTYQTKYLFRSYDSSDNKFYPGCFSSTYAVNTNMFAKFFKLGDNSYFFALPLFTARNGKLGYWDISFLYHKKGGIRDFDSLVKNYFLYYPEKEKEYNKLISQREVAIRDEENKKQKIEALDRELKQIEGAVADYNQEIETLQKKIFGKKKAQQQIEDINKRLSETNNQKETKLNERNRLASNNKPFETSIDFYWGLMDKYDNFIPWKWVEEE